MRREGPSTGRLTALLERYLSHTSRRGGEAYYAQGRVSRVRATPTEYTAAVRGSESYTVSLSVQGQRLVLDCSCPYFQDDYDVCKHVWAAALDAEGVLRLPPHVVVDFSEDLDDESLDDIGDQELFEDDVATTAGLSSAQRLAVAERMKRYWAERRQRGASPTPPRRPPAPAAWETFLAQVGSQPSEDSSARALLGELVYVFDPNAVRASGWGAHRTPDTRTEEVRRVDQTQICEPATE